MAEKQKGSSPSRIKYEQANPVVSTRVAREIHSRLRALEQSEGVSMADVLKAGLGLIEVKVRAEHEIRQKAYDQGWEKGIQEACNAFLVTYLCSVCGKEIEVTTDAEKRAIRTYMRQYGWGHADCVDPR